MQNRIETYTTTRVLSQMHQRYDLLLITFSNGMSEKLTTKILSIGQTQFLAKKNSI
jgi:hypothetical protein